MCVSLSVCLSLSPTVTLALAALPHSLTLLLMLCARFHAFLSHCLDQVDALILVPMLWSSLSSWRTVVIVGLVLFARKKNVNLSALGLGVDFLQVVSIFSAFGFTWPIQLSSLFTVASASTFNFQIVAPGTT